MMSRWPMVFLLSVTIAVGAASPADAQNRCAGYKLKTTARKPKCLAAEYAHAAQSSSPPQQSDIEECEAKFAIRFEKIELKGGCLTTGDAAAIESKVDAFVADLVAELDNGNNSRCQGLKILAAAVQARCLLLLDAREASRAEPIDPERVAKCQHKFDAVWADLEAAPGCETTGDAGAIDAKVDAFVADVDGELAP